MQLQQRDIMADLFAIEEENDLRALPGFSPIAVKTATHVNDLPEGEAALIKKTIAQMPHITTPTPHPADKSLNGRVSLGPVDEKANSEIALQAVLEFPNLAWEAIKAGLAKEEISNRQLNGYIQEAEKHQKDIDLLLNFSAELTGHKEDIAEMSEKMKQLLSELKDRGIDLVKGADQTLNKEKIAELKSLASSRVDQLRSNVQILFTTKIQVQIQSIGAIMETLKDIIRNNTKLISTANRLPGR